LWLTSARAPASLRAMPRPKSDAIAELSAWMEQSHQLAAALAILDARLGWHGQAQPVAEAGRDLADEPIRPAAGAE
jgi:hypothetical protein